jgi:hypothetical protein
MKQENFLYFGKRPTNVCYNGVSFPILGGDVVRCYREFWEAFIPDERTYKVIPDDDPRKPKYTFGRSPVFIKPDPSGGLPMRSTSKPDTSLLKAKMRERLLNPPEDREYVNPYDLGVDENPALEMSTAPDKPSAPEPKTETFTTAPPAEALTELNPVPDEIEAPPVEEEVVDTPEEESVNEHLLGRSAIRKLTRSEVFAETQRILELSCPSNPDFIEVFASFDGEEDGTTRGVMFDALWDYCGYKAK